MPNLPAIHPRWPKTLMQVVRWVKEHSKTSEGSAPTAAELAEGVWPRAKRDAKRSGTGTFSGGIALALGTGLGVHLAGKDHAPGRPPSALVELGFPVAGFIAAAAFILFVRLLLTFRVQRNEARTALVARANGSAAPTLPPPDGPKVKYQGVELTGSTTETSKDILEALRSSGLVETPEGPRNIEQLSEGSHPGPTEASGS